MVDDVRPSSERVSLRTLCLCAAVAPLVVIAAVPTFFVDGILNGTPVMNGSARGTALTMFALALPVLVVGIVTSTRGSVRGRAALIGALGYSPTTPPCSCMPPRSTSLFLAYVALLGLSLWSLVSALLDSRPLPARTASCPRAASPRSS